MPHLSLKPTHAPIRAYYKALAQYGKLGFDNEGNIRNTFEDLLKKCCSQFRWTVVPEYRMTGKDKGRISIDAALQKKFRTGCPRTDILFKQAPRLLLSSRCEERDLLIVTARFDG